MPTAHILMASGGIGSWAAGMLVREEYPDDQIVSLFADTKTEDADLYRFLPEAAASINSDLVITAEGRTIWEVFRDERMLGNTQFDPCSKFLKRLWLRKWLTQNCDPLDTVVYLGYGHWESHRLAASRSYWSPWEVEAPLTDRGDIGQKDVMEWVGRAGLRLPRLYGKGFLHNNCGGLCVKAGVSQFVHALEVLPEVFAEWERKEAELRAQLGDVAILRDRRGGVTRPMPLTVLRGRVEAGEKFRRAERFRCACFAGDD